MWSPADTAVADRRAAPDAPPLAGMASQASPPPVDTRGWHVTARDVAGIKQQIQQQVASSGAAVADVLRLFDVDCAAERLIDDMEFLNGLRTHFKYVGNPLLISQVFKSIDTDGSNMIGFDELYEFVRGQRHALDKRNQPVPPAMPVEPPDGATWSLCDVAWDGETLRMLIGAALARHRVASPTALLSAWSAEGKQHLSRDEFVHALQTTFFEGQPTLWQSELAPLADEAFVAAAGRHEAAWASSKLERRLDAKKLHAWLTKRRPNAYTHTPDAPPLKSSCHERRASAAPAPAPAAAVPPAARRPLAARPLAIPLGDPPPGGPPQPLAPHGVRRPYTARSSHQPCSSQHAIKVATAAGLHARLIDGRCLMRASDLPPPVTPRALVMGVAMAKVAREREAASAMSHVFQCERTALGGRLLPPMAVPLVAKAVAARSPRQTLSSAPAGARPGTAGATRTRALAAPPPRALRPPSSPPTPSSPRRHRRRARALCGTELGTEVAGPNRTHVFLEHEVSVR